MEFISKKYATKMECIATIYDGSTGETHARGFGLVTATTIDLRERRKALPRPLLFETFSSTEEEFVSQPHIWLEAIDRLCAATPGGVFAIDREGDNGRIIRRLVDRRRHFVIRLNVGDNSRHLIFNAKSRARVRDVWKEADFYGEMVCERLADDGTRKPYKADFGSLPVRVPGIDKDLYICVFDSPDHEQPLVLLTSQKADTPESTAHVLTQYFSRWIAEEMHRFSKQAFKLENIRLLTWRRLRNMVAMVWIAMGALCVLGEGPRAASLLRVLEVRGGRVRKPLCNGQFWGYAIIDGVRAIIQAGGNLLHLLSHLWPSSVSPQLAFPFGGRA